MTTDNPRTDFEAWAEEKGFLLARERNGSYARPVTQAIYLAWQAATSLALEKASTAVREVANDYGSLKQSAFNSKYGTAILVDATLAAIRALKDK